MITTICSTVSLGVFIAIGILAWRQEDNQYKYTTQWSRQQSWLMYAALIVSMICNVALAANTVIGG